LNGIYETKANYVFDYLKEQITKGKYQQGESIVISRVADELEMSTIPVREALKRLESEGLVELTPHKGAQVTTFNSKKINDVLEVRAVLEGYAARAACDRIDDSTFRKLTDMNEEMRNYANKGMDEKFSTLNKEFHRILYNATKNSTLFDAIFNLWDGGNWSKSLFAYFPEKMMESVTEHDEILSAIKNNSPELAEKITREHKMKNIKYYLELSGK